MPPTVVDRLEKDGLVRRTPSETDRRTVYVALTPEGLAQFEGLGGAITRPRSTALFVGHLSEADLDALTDILKRMGESAMTTMAGLTPQHFLWEVRTASPRSA